MNTTHHYSVAVGIDRYPALRDLCQASSDAKAFHEWVVDPAGGAVPVGNAKLIVVDQAELPDPLTREVAVPIQKQVFAELNRIRREVDARLEADPDVWEQTRLYFYVSGHGIAPEPGDAALLMADAGPYDYGENISCGALQTFFAKAQTFRELLVFADCCREYAEAPLGVPPWTPLRRNFGNVNQVFACATYFGDYAFEAKADPNAPPDEQRGYFTRALLEGLRGELGSGGVIDTPMLAGYVQKRVRDLTSHRQHAQEVSWVGESARPVVLRKSSRQDLHTTELRFSDPSSGVVDLLSGKREILAIHDTAAGPWILRLPNGLYRARARRGGAPPFRRDGFFEVWGEATRVDL